MVECDKQGAIHVEWLSAYTDCDQPGCSGGYSEGARVIKDGDVWFELPPRASCFGGSSWDKEEVFTEIMRRLGFVFTCQYGGEE